MKGKIIYNACCIIFWLLVHITTTAQTGLSIVVSANGHGDFSTIQAALNSLSDTSVTPRVIFIKNGIYHEKVFIEKSNVVLQGENKDSTILVCSIARDEWRCTQPDDWGAATLNVGASDITLLNMTVRNDYGFTATTRTIICQSDSTQLSTERIVRKDGHQMTVRVMKFATRLKAINSRFISYGGDTMSPWEVNNGMWYFKNCSFEGGVDFYCPRGWAWAEDCVFYAHTGPASIWHDGSGNLDAKAVFKNCRFDGYEGFYLGRYHREAQFFLIDCFFSKNMRDSAIYNVPTSTPLHWGQRVYYFNCKREGGNDFTWYRDHLPLNLPVTKITPQWLFGNRWAPYSN